MLNWEVALVIVVLVILGSGLVRLAMKRQMEILKDFLLPKDSPLKRTILRPGKDQITNKNPQDQAESDLQENATEPQPVENSQSEPQTAEMAQPPVEQSNMPQNVS